MSPNNSAVSIALTLGALLDRNAELWRDMLARNRWVGEVEFPLLYESLRGSKRRALERERRRRQRIVETINDALRGEMLELDHNIENIMRAIRERPERAAILRLAGFPASDE